MVPLFVYIGVLETFLANNYPSIYNNSGLFLSSNNANKKALRNKEEEEIKLFIID